MKKHLLVCILILVVWDMKAQISINVSSPPPLNLRARDIYNATVINSGNIVNVYFKAILTNTSTGKIVLEGKSNIINLNKGSIILNEGLLQPTYNFYSESFRASGLAPYGNYEICITVISINNNEVIGEGCIAVEVTPMSPPLLINPENESEINEQYPLLTWLAPTPLKALGSVLYDIKIVEIFPNQTPYDAIQRNYGVLELRGIKNTFLQYPVTAMKLDSSKKYAWRVIAKTNDGNILGETEVWVFRLSNENLTETTDNKADVYILLNQNQNSQSLYVFRNKQLALRFQDIINSGVLNIRITSATTARQCVNDVNIDGGRDLSLVVNLDTCDLKKNQTYIIEILINNKLMYEFTALYK